MKFGKYLIAHKKSEWNEYYVDYKLLKKNINNENFIELVHNEVKKVNCYYNLLSNLDSDKNELDNFIILNYMAIFKSIKKNDKKHCNLLKNYFFNYIIEQSFYKDFISKTRVSEETKCIIFDKDGTLINNEKMFGPFIEDYINNINEKYKIDKDRIYRILKYSPIDKIFYEESVASKGTMDEIKNFLINFIMDETGYIDRKKLVIDINNFVPKVIINNDTLQPFCDLKELFCNLKSKGIKIAICTSDDRENTLLTLKLLNCIDYLDCIVCGDDSLSNKPSPDPIWYICKELEVLPKNCIMVGDTSYDIHSGINSRCGKIFGVKTGGNNLLSGCDKLLNDITEIIDNIII